MSLKMKIIICLICIVVCEKIWGIPSGFCAANVSEETLWVSLDISPEQRKQVDEIIFKAYKQIKIEQKNMKITDLDNPDEYVKLVAYMNQMTEIRKNINNNIMRLLSPKQRSIFESQLEQTYESKKQFAAILMMLELTKDQQTKIVAMLLKNQKKVWSIISSRSLSWEQKRKQLDRINKIKQISSRLSKRQQENFSYLLGITYLQNSNEILFSG